MALTNLSSSLISATYGKVVQTEGNVLADGTGTRLDLLYVTASYATYSDNADTANTATTASYVETVLSSSYALTASYAANASTPNLQQVTDEGATTTNAISGPRINLGGSGTNGVVNVYDTSDNEIFRATATGVQIGGLSQNYDLLHYGDTTQNGDINATGYAVTASFKGNLDGTAATASYVGDAMYTGSISGNTLTFTKGDSSTFDLDLSGVSPDLTALNEFTASADARLDSLETATGSYATTAELTATASLLQSDIDTNTADITVATASILSNDNRISGIEAISGAFARTDQNNTFVGLQTFNNIAVNGTGSFAYIESVTGSAKIIGDAFLILNNQTPAERYAGIKVIDSGSSPAVTASLLFDGQTNDWFYEYVKAGDPDNYSVILAGPEYGTMGSPIYPAANQLQKGAGGHHLTGSLLSDDGSTVSMTGELDVTGGITSSAGFVGDLTGNASTATSATSASYALTASYAANAVTPTLQQVTTQGAITSNNIETSDGSTSVATLYGNGTTLEFFSSDDSTDQKVAFSDSEGGNFAELTFSPSSGDVNLTGGTVKIQSLAYPSSDGSSGQALVTNGAGTLSFSSVLTTTPSLDQVVDVNNYVTSDGIQINAPHAYDIEISSYTPGSTLLRMTKDSLFFDDYDGAVNQEHGLFSDGTNLTVSASEGSVIIDAKAGSNVTIRGLNYPATDGTSGQAIVTDGLGTLSFSDIAGDPEGATDTGVTSVVFDNAIATVYNTAASPATGNITLSGTGAVTGGTAVIYHNDSTAPTISGLTVDKTLGVYSESNLNIITIIYTGTNVIVSIAGISPAVEGSVESGNLLFENQIGEIYGTSGTPLTGNITIDGSSTKVIGASVIMYHEDSSEPTVSGGTIVKKVGSYDTTGLNMISFVYLGSGNYIQSIAGADVTGIITNTGDTYTSTAKVQSIVTCTAAEYAALTPDANTFYIVI